MGVEKASQLANAASIPYPDKYHAAVKYVEVVADGGKQLKDEAQLLLYALHQQATSGPCTSAKPWGWNVVESAKWQAWRQLGNLSGIEAMRLYVRTLEEEEANWYALLTAEESRHSSRTAEVAASPCKNKVPTAIAGPNTTPSSVQLTLRPAVEYAQDGTWSVLPLHDQKRPLPRYEHAAGLIAGSIYVIGGNYGGRYLSDCWRFNLITSQWTQLNLTADSSSSVSLTATPDQPAAAVAAVAASAEKANGKAVTSAAVPGSPLAPVAGHQVVAWHSSLVVLGGHTKGKDAKTSLPVRILDTNTLMVSMAQTQGSIPVARGGHTASIIGSKVYVFGGEDAARRTLGDLHILDLETMAWTAPETSGIKPLPRSAHAATTYQSRYVLVFGGGSVATCYNDVVVLDTQTLTWSTPVVTGPKVTPRAGHAGGTLGDSWYIVGGGNNVKGCTEMFALDLSQLPSGGALTWRVVLSIPLRDPLSSEGVSILPLEPSKVLLAFGGYNGKYQNSVSVFRAPAAAAAARSAAAKASEMDIALGRSVVPPSGSAASSQSVKDTPPPPDAPAAAAAAGAAAIAAISGASGQAPAAAASTAAEAKALLANPATLETVAELRAQLDAAHHEVNAAAAEVAAARSSAAHELKLLRSQLAAAEAGQAEAQKALDECRSTLQREQAKVLKLEAEAAEMQRRLSAMADLEKEVDKYHRITKEAEEVKAKAAGGGGIWGYLAGSSTNASSSS